MTSVSAVPATPALIEIEPDAPSAPVSFVAAARGTVLKPLEEMLMNWDGVRSGNDAEAVHDMRVASRRLRAALSVFESAVSSREFLRFEQQVETLTDALGQVRDTDVFLEFLQLRIDDLTPEREPERTGLEDYCNRLRRDRIALQTKLMKVLKQIKPEDLRFGALAMLDTLTGESSG